MSGPTVGEVREDPTVRRVLERRQLREETALSYIKGIRSFCEYHGGRPSEVLERIRGLDEDGLVDAFADWLAWLGRRVAPKSAWNWLGGVRAWLVENGVEAVDRVGREIAREFKRKVGEVKVLLKRDVLTKEEVVRLLKAADRRMKALIALLASSGLRIGAALKLQLKHFRDDLWNVELPCYAVEIPGSLNKEGEPYITFVSAEAAEYLRDYLERRREEGEELGPDTYLFVTERGRRPLSVKRVENTWRELCHRAGVDLRPVPIRGYHPVRRKGGGVELRRGEPRYNARIHSLRKFFRTALSTMGVDRLAAEVFMGHSLAQFGVESIYNYAVNNLQYLREEYIKALPALTFLKPVPAVPTVDHEARRRVEELQAALARREEELRALRERLERMERFLDRFMRIPLEDLEAMLLEYKRRKLERLINDEGE